nr:MAG TPA: putative exported protein [Caudoviricetes sp.]
MSVGASLFYNSPLGQIFIKNHYRENYGNE